MVIGVLTPITTHDNPLRGVGHNRTGADQRARVVLLYPRGFGRVAALENNQRALDARHLRAIDDGVEIGGELLVGEMAVGINHNERCQPYLSSPHPRSWCRRVLECHHDRLAAAQLMHGYCLCKRVNRVDRRGQGPKTV